MAVYSSSTICECMETAKQIHELDPLNKINGKEEILIDDGQLTYKVTVDTLLGYIRDQINNNAQPGTSSDGGTTIHFIPEGETIGVTQRETGHYYINVDNSMSPGYRGNIVQNYRISPNMGLRMIIE